jgi:hypothetical protein
MMLCEASDASVKLLRQVMSTCQKADGRQFRVEYEHITVYTALFAV